MFEFIRKKRDSGVLAKATRPEADAESKSRFGLRRNSLIQRGKGEESSTKRIRHLSGPPTIETEYAEHAGRPANARARSSSCSAASSLDLRNPFAEHGDSAMTASQVDLTGSTPSLGPPAENMRYVVSHAPVLVSPQASRAEVFFSEDMVNLQKGDALASNPFTDTHVPPICTAIDDAHAARPEEDASEEATPTKKSFGTASLASFRLPVDYLQVKIPAGVMSPPLSDAHRSMWARI